MTIALWMTKNVNFIEKPPKFRWLSFHKTYSPASSKFVFKYIFHPLSMDDISISFCSTGRHTFFGAIICVEINGFQAFLRKRWEKRLIRDVTMPSNF
jgi:hypothetical protein